MIRLYNLDFCKLEIYHNYMVAVMNEGIVVCTLKNSILIKIAEKHFKKTPFVYITHRLNSYAVDPIIYIKTAEVSNLIGFAVVSNDPKQKILTTYEKSFFKKEFKQFENLEAALIWKDDIVKKNNDDTTSISKQKKSTN
ncbi:hypothetical protein SAMN04487910_0026 [Aquimarina amphilecti]|uniref:SpoIIAA-like n=1 Tax=Aquimarina amphilecti TaxID=1038014 RepID=A0A1H7FFI1_AQUAM|nr:hypothetical protein [Aquimarina amphilecti]SEK23182.1 hypothetical protein SAMN04487910_0026 [Aquimarina amphilecti]